MKKVAKPKQPIATPVASEATPPPTNSVISKRAAKTIVKPSSQKKLRITAQSYVDDEAVPDGAGHGVDEGDSGDEEPTPEDRRFINDDEEDGDEESDEAASEDADGEANGTDGVEDEDSSQDQGEEVEDEEEEEEEEENDEENDHNDVAGGDAASEEGYLSEDSENGSSTGSERARNEERMLIDSVAKATVSKAKKPKKTREEWYDSLDDEGKLMWDVMNAAYAPDKIELFFERVLVSAEQAVQDKDTDLLPRTEGTQGHNWINAFTQTELRNALTDAGYDLTKEGSRGIPNAFVHTGYIWTYVGEHHKEFKKRALALHEEGKQIMRDEKKIKETHRTTKAKKKKRRAQNDGGRKTLSKQGKISTYFPDTLSQDDRVFSVDLGKHILSVLTPAIRKWISTAMRKKDANLSEIFDMGNFGKRSSSVANELERQRTAAADFIEFHELMGTDDGHGRLEFEKADEFGVEFHHPPEKEKQVKILRCPPFFARATLSFEPEREGTCTPYFLFDNIGLKVKTSGQAIEFMSSCGISVTLDRPFTGWFYFASQLGHELVCLGQFGLGN